MSHFAKIENGIVTQVIVAEQDVIDSGLFGTGWVQTSYNTRGGIHYGQDGQPDGGIALRANYAGVGYTYDATNDVFYEPRPLDKNNIPCESWTIGSPTWIWVPPISIPTNENPLIIYVWDEAIQNWVQEND
jgi:hypothetical protein